MNLGVSVDCAQGIKELGVHLMTLANNHIMDHGLAGLESTVAALNHVGIETVGAGKTWEDAIRPYQKQYADNNVYLLTYAENEFNVANKTRSGASPLDINLIVRQMLAAPKNAFKIVILHAGNEHFQLPNPWLRDTCRLIVELGANLVVVQHSHCIGTYEEYQNSLIIYGQGNFIFDHHSNDDFVDLWECGVLLSASIDRNKLDSYKLIPYRQNPAKGILRLTDESETKSILAGMDERSAIVRSENGLDEQWEVYCRRKKESFQNQLFGYGHIMRRLNSRFHIADKMSKKSIMNIGNILRCQAHYEILKTIFSQDNTTNE